MILSQHEDSEYDEVWYTRHQREKEKAAEALKSPTKTDKLKFESVFERLMAEKNEEGNDQYCGLFSGTGMFDLEEDSNNDSNSNSNRTQPADSII